MAKRIGIIGCGWLGKALAEQLVIRGDQVVTTVRTQDKAIELSEGNFICLPLALPIETLRQHQVFQHDIIVVAITPQFKKGRIDYAQNIEQIIDAAEHTGVVKLILVSSTGALAGNTGVINEDAAYLAEDEKSVLLQQAEQSVINAKLQGKVIRMSGLVGEDRKPGRFLAGKQDLKQALAPVNLIHQIDAIGLLLKLIDSDTSQQIFHGVSNTLVNRKDFYQQAAKSMRLEPPTFSDVDLGENGKRILGDKTRVWLDYQYQVDDLLNWL